MEPIIRIDERLVEATERGFLSFRTKLGMSHPAAMSWAGSLSVFLMALSVFLGSGSLLYTKVPLLFLYAGLAYLMGRTVFRQLHSFHHNWNAETQRILTNLALGNRRKLFPLRLVVAFASIIFVTMAATISLKLYGFGAMTFAQALLNVLCSLLGLPVLLLYQYLQCAKPNGGRAL
jgi:hypothetical protein